MTPQRRRDTEAAENISAASALLCVSAGDIGKL
jgi:hypothetical protein